ncbi:chemotaxis protein CheX [Desulfogranum mediterraneum]|uniref:chemotaxis protein CheX n=1 Tax=Desulfogranum mediterraneum TaxID=160661 RepID=UPI0004910109|nr:chemotaxis protein CheX [Desulfogranum mediterraneum]
MDVNTELAPRLTESTLEIFTGMVMMEIEPLEETAAALGVLHNSITGMVGLAGTHKGLLAVHLPEAVALAVTGSFLGMEVAEINEDVQDAIGEIANMLGGDLKMILSDKGKDIQLSLPSTISGETYTFASSADIDHLVLPFKAPDGIFQVVVELEK